MRKPPVGQHAAVFGDQILGLPLHGGSQLAEGPAVNSLCEGSCRTPFVLIANN